MHVGRVGAEDDARTYPAQQTGQGTADPAVVAVRPAVHAAQRHQLAVGQTQLMHARGG